MNMSILSDISKKELDDLQLLQGGEEEAIERR